MDIQRTLDIKTCIFLDYQYKSTSIKEFKNHIKRNGIHDSKVSLLKEFFDTNKLFKYDFGKKQMAWENEITTTYCTPDKMVAVNLWLRNNEFGYDAWWRPLHKYGYIKKVKSNILPIHLFEVWFGDFVRTISDKHRIGTFCTRGTCEGHTIN